MMGGCSADDELQIWMLCSYAYNAQILNLMQRIRFLNVFMTTTSNEFKIKLSLLHGHCERNNKILAVQLSRCQSFT